MTSVVETVLDVDVLVIGAGSGGMTVALMCAQRGEQVAVVEIADSIGGSSIMSEGYLWTLEGTQDFREDDPSGDVARFGAMLAELPAAFDWLESLNVRVGPWLHVTRGPGRQVDVVQFFSRAEKMITALDGFIFTGTDTRGLLRDGDRVLGAEVITRSSGERALIRAKHTVLATGGFHADSTLRSKYRLPSAEELLVRGNPWNTGGGLRLGLDAGGVESVGMHSFYGHAVPYPLSNLERRDFTRMVQFQVMQGVLLNKEGARFCDESRSYSYAGREVARQGTALLVIDERVRNEYLLKPFLPSMETGLDKMEEAGSRGANFTRGSLADIAKVASKWGYDQQGVVTAIEQFNEAMTGRSTDGVPRSRSREPLDRAPYSALEVQGSITFTFGGLATDIDGRVTGKDGAPVPGLYAVGVEAGGLNVEGYAGGLVRGFALGRRTADAISGTSST